MPMELTYLLAAESPTVTANPLFPNIPWFTNSVLVTIIVTILGGDMGAPIDCENDLDARPYTESV